MEILTLKDLRQQAKALQAFIEVNNIDISNMKAQEYEMLKSWWDKIRPTLEKQKDRELSFDDLINLMKPSCLFSSILH